MDHTIVNFEIPANDLQKIRKFYSDLFGWKIEKMDTSGADASMEYYVIATVPLDEKGNPIRPGVFGGLYKKQMPEQEPVNYISVESVDEYSKKVAALGGQIVVPKMEIKGMGWFALALDPEGNQFGIFEALPMP
jgi:predicted enzyme related to lactoylglutathione lyase